MFTLNKICKQIVDLTIYEKNPAKIRENDLNKSELCELLKELKKSIGKDLGTLIRRNRVRKRKTSQTSEVPNKKQKLDEEAHNCFHFNSCCCKKKSDDVDRCLTTTHFCLIHGLVHDDKGINHDDEDDIKTTSIRSAIDLSV